MARMTPYQFVQRQQRYTSARDMLRMLGLLCLLVSGAFWLPIQWQLVAPGSPTEMVVAIAFGLFLVLGPPIFTSFFIPWSPAAQLIARVNAKTIGQSVALGVMLYLLYYAGFLGLTWWQARPVVAAANLSSQQMLIGIIATIICPALLWAPASPEELEDILKQDQMVRRYQLQTEADIAICRAALLDAQTIAAKGLLESIKVFGPERIAYSIQTVLTGLDESIAGIAHQVSGLSDVYVDIPGFEYDGEDVRGILQYLGDSALAAAERPAPALPVARGQTIDLGAPVPQQDAERELTREVTREREPEPPRLAAARSGSREPADTEDAYRVMWERFGAVQAWGRSDVEDAIGCKSTKAGDLIKAWKDRQWIVGLDNIKDRYQCAEEVVS